MDMNLYNETMRKIESHFPAFAAEAKSEDLHMTKVAFYTAMITGMTEKTPLADADTQKRVLMQLSALRDHSLEIIADRNEN